MTGKGREGKGEKKGREKAREEKENGGRERGEERNSQALCGGHTLSLNLRHLCVYFAPSESENLLSSAFMRIGCSSRSWPLSFGISTCREVTGNTFEICTVCLKDVRLQLSGYSGTRCNVEWFQASTVCQKLYKGSVLISYSPETERAFSSIV